VKPQCSAPDVSFQTVSLETVRKEVRAVLDSTFWWVHNMAKWGFFAPFRGLAELRFDPYRDFSDDFEESLLGNSTTLGHEKRAGAVDSGPPVPFTGRPFLADP
jgi:hypothetical protein